MPDSGVAMTGAERSRKWREAHPGRAREQDRRWRELHREAVLAKARVENMTPEQIRAKHARQGTRRYNDQQSIRNATKTIAKYEASINKSPHQEGAL